MNNNEFDIEKFILENHNPNNQYFLIKQNIKNLNSDVFEFDEFIDKENFKRFQKIDIFRGTVQYLEEFLLYFLAKFNNEKYSEVLARTDNKKIFEKMTLIFKLNDLSTLLMDKMELNELNVNDFLNILKNIMDFFTAYKDIYNSIKHGFRVFPYDFNYFMLGNDEIPYEKLDISEKYVQFICKHEKIIYTVAYPIDCLVEDSDVVLEYINECFNFIMGKNNYENSIDFSCPSTKKFNHYVHLRNGEATIFFKYDKWFDKYLSKNELFFTAKFSHKGNKFKIHLSAVPEYPFLVHMETNKILSTSPELFDIKNINFISFSEHGSIDQVKILNELLTSNDENFNYSAEFNGFEYECPNVNLEKLSKLNFEEKIINILFRLKQILEIEIYYPVNLHEKQYELLISHDGRFDNKIHAKDFVKELKKYNKTVINVFLDLLDSEGNLFDERFLGSTYDLTLLDIFHFEQLEDEKHIYSVKAKNPSGDILLNLSKLEKKLSESNDLSDLEKLNFSEELTIKVGYIKKFWINEYNVSITARLK